MHEIRFPYSPALYNTVGDTPVDFEILVYVKDNEIVWTFLDLTLRKYEQIIDWDVMWSDITRRARRKMEKHLQTV